MKRCCFLSLIFSLSVDYSSFLLPIKGTEETRRIAHLLLKISKKALLNMTGSNDRYIRQCSSTTTGSSKGEVHQPKLRRCSSADEQNPSEFIPMVLFSKEKFSFKRVSPTSDIDSGTEEVEQQSEHVFLPASSDTDEVIPQFDEGFSEYEREEDPQLTTIKQDRKFLLRVFLLCHYDSA